MEDGRGSEGVGGCDSPCDGVYGEEECPAHHLTLPWLRHVLEGVGEGGTRGRMSGREKGRKIEEDKREGLTSSILLKCSTWGSPLTLEARLHTSLLQ